MKVANLIRPIFGLAIGLMLGLTLALLSGDNPCTFSR